LIQPQGVLAHPIFIALGVALARLLPTRASYAIIRRVAHILARQRTLLFRTVCANLAHVVPDASAQELDALAERALYHAGRSLVDMYRVSREDLRDGRVALRVDPQAWAQMHQAIRDGRGMVIAGPHMGSFDLAIQWIAAQDVDLQVLGLAQPNRGVRVTNWLRRRRGVRVNPVDTDALRTSIARLRRGGVVITGVDRPVSLDDEPIPFFDAPARLPTGHIRLAMQTRARLVAATCVLEPDGVYALHLSAPIEPELGGGRAHDIRHNARRVLAFIEDEIRRNPDQWLMFVPAWRAEDALPIG
jgi:phosphatidylinositol dimannoside acyltransferase